MAYWKSHVVTSIIPAEGSLEKDARFLFCACAVSYMLNDWSGLDLDLSLQYAKRLQVRRIAVIWKTRGVTHSHVFRPMKAPLDKLLIMRLMVRRRMDYEGGWY